MTLLAPLSALLAGVLAFPILVLYYMLKLRRRPLTVSSTFLWEQAQRDVQANVPLRWIRPSLLFLLHALILALLALALGRPAIERTGASSARAFFLIDCSASMAATDGIGGITRLEAAKSQALEVGRRLLGAPGRPVIMLMSFAHDASISSRPIDSVRELRIALDAIKPVDQPGRLGPALQLTQSLIATPTDEATTPSKPLVTIFSDGVFTDSTPLTLAGATVSIVPVETQQQVNQGNLAIVACSAARSESNPATARLFVRIESTFKKRIPVSIEILVDGHPTNTHALVVPQATEDGPGTVGHSFIINIPDGALLTAAIPMDDLLESDNQASVYLPQPRKPRALLVHPESEPADPYLRDVLEEIPLRSLRVMPESTFGEFSLDQIADAFELIVFDRVAPFEFPAVPTLSFGAWGGEFDTQSTSEVAGGFVLTWDRSAPELAHVTFDTVQITRLRAPPDSSALAALGTPHELASVRTGPAITRLETPTGTRVFVGFRLDDSNWPLQFSFPIFMLNTVEYLTGLGSSHASIAFSTNEPVIVRATAADSTLRLERPDDRSIEKTVDQPGLTSLGVIDTAGVYRLDGAALPVVAVNLFSSIESQLGVSTSLVVGGQETPRFSSTVGRAEIWHWLVGAAGLLLVFEWLLYASRVRL